MEASSSPCSRAAAPWRSARTAQFPRPAICSSPLKVGRSPAVAPRCRHAAPQESCPASSTRRPTIWMPLIGGMRPRQAPYPVRASATRSPPLPPLLTRGSQLLKSYHKAPREQPASLPIPPHRHSHPHPFSTDIRRRPLPPWLSQRHSSAHPLCNFRSYSFRPSRGIPRLPNRLHPPLPSSLLVGSPLLLPRPPQAKDSHSPLQRPRSLRQPLRPRPRH